MASGFSGKIFFYCIRPEYPPGNNPGFYPHLFVCLAEGLKELGIEIYSNMNFWRTSSENEEYLFCHDPEIMPDDCAVVVIDQHWLHYSGKPFPDNLFHPKRKYTTVYLDNNDGFITPSWRPEFRQFDFVLKAHYNSKWPYPSNFHPWAVGLSSRMLRATENLPTFKERKRQILVNFRIMHPVRDIFRKKFLPQLESVLPSNNSVDSFNAPPSEPYDYIQWDQTGKRHYPSYYKRLKEVAACACVGGHLIPSWPKDPQLLYGGIWRKILRKTVKLTLLKLEPTRARLAQWDSWRFWESLAAGCVTFQVDFEKHGLFLPVMPENWRHYIGVDLDKPQEAVRTIADDPEILERISTEGRLWALEHYSPVATARRFLNIVVSK